MPPTKKENSVRGRSVWCPCRSLPSPRSGKTGERGNQWPRHLGWGERRVITAKRNTSASPTANPAGDSRDVLPSPATPDAVRGSPRGGGRPAGRRERGLLRDPGTEPRGARRRRQEASALPGRGGPQG